MIHETLSVQIFFHVCDTSLSPHVASPGMPSVLDWTDDGFSMCFGVNHLGHFLLTNMLLPRLRESAPSRVVTLTCSSYKYQKLDFQDLNYNLLPFFTYCRSKLANIYFSQELARITEGKGVTSYAVHPGKKLKIPQNVKKMYCIRVQSLTSLCFKDLPISTYVYF